MKNFIRCLIACLLIVAVPAFPQGFTGMFPGPGTPHAAGGGCTSNGPLDVVSETGIEAVGLRALKKTYSGMVIKISTAGTTGTYNDVGLTGCDLNTTTLSGCTSTSAPTTTTGCPIQTFYDQSGNGCNATQATGANQAWLVVNQINTHPTVFFGGSANYQCTLPGSTGAAAYAGEFYLTDPGSSYSIASIGNGTNNGTKLYRSISGESEFDAYDGTNTSNSPGTAGIDAYANFVADAPNSSAAVLLVNDAYTSFGASIGTILTGTKFVLGADTAVAVGFFFQGRMGELVVVGAIASCGSGGSGTGDCAALYTNQSGYW